MGWKTLRVYVRALLTCFHQRKTLSSSSTATTVPKTTATATARATRLGLIVYPAPQESPTHSWIQSRLRYQGHKELLTGLWRRWDAAAKALLDRARQRTSRADMEVTDSPSVMVPFGRSRDQRYEGGSADTQVGAQALSQLGRAVSDILTLMRMVCYTVLSFVLSSLPRTHFPPSH